MMLSKYTMAGVVNNHITCRKMRWVRAKIGKVTLPVFYTTSRKTQSR